MREVAAIRLAGSIENFRVGDKWLRIRLAG